MRVQYRLFFYFVSLQKQSNSRKKYVFLVAKCSTMLQTLSICCLVLGRYGTMSLGNQCCVNMAAQSEARLTLATGC